MKTTNRASKVSNQPVVSQVQMNKDQGFSNLTFTDIDEKTVKVDPNKKTILHFIISTGCTSCGDSEINLAKFSNKANLDLVSIAIDPSNDTKESMHEFMKATKAQWPHIIDKDHSLIGKFHVTSIDSVIVLYQNKIVFSGVDPSPSELEKVLT
jgi:cytochrome oxidase Cu insertion factor (SCO1/SenC/PrrC family)